MDQQLMCAEDRVSTFSKSVTKDGMACVKAPGLISVGDWAIWTGLGEEAVWTGRFFTCTFLS